jgi:orotate phosphoribosyltransferase
MSWDEEKQAIARTILALLYEKRMIRTFFRDRPEGWTLISGLYSPLYIQLRPLISYPDVMAEVARAMARMVREEAPEITRVIGIAMAGVPIVAAMSVMGGIPGGFTRKMENVKSPEEFRDVIGRYGEHALLEGELTGGDRIALVDDLVTRFDSKLVALEQVNHEVKRRNLADVECRKVAVVLDREQGGQEAARKEGVELLSLIPFKQVGLPLLEDVMHRTEWDVLTRYLQDPDYFQNKEIQDEIAREAAGTAKGR